MSIYSDFECGAISDEELRNFGVRMNRKDRYEQEEELEDDSTEEG